MDIIDGTRIKSCYDSTIDREYFMESLSVWYFTHEFVVSEIEQGCAANQKDLWYKPTRCFLFCVFDLHALRVKKHYTRFLKRKKSDMRHLIGSRLLDQLDKKILFHAFSACKSVNLESVIFSILIG